MPSESETGKIHNVPHKKRTERAAPKKTSKKRRQSAADPPVRQLIRFMIDNSEFGVDIGQVREIRRASDMTVKGAESSDVIGVIAVSEEVIDVVDVGQRLGYPLRTIGPNSRVVIFQSGDTLQGALVDEVIEVLRLEQTVEDKPGGADLLVDPELIREILVIDDKRIMVLDWPRLLGRVAK